MKAVMPQGAVATSGRPAGELLGHPRGLFYLAFTEAWERFSYYGMMGLLALYMVNQLLLPGHVEHVAGFAAVRAALESVAGPLSVQALAAQIFGLYAGLVYFTPVFGGLIADRWTGQRNAVMIGATAMCAGHVAMAFDRTFLAALVLLVVGSGFLKGNISTQVGALYPGNDRARRSRGFVIFSTGINVGATVGPLVCGLLAQVYGWHYGFGVAAIGMLVAMATYLHGYRYLPARVTRPHRATTGLDASDWRIIRVVVAVLGISIFESITYGQVFNVHPVWIEQHVGLDLAGYRIPVPWFLALHSMACVAVVPLIAWVWRHQARRGRVPGELDNIGTSAWLMAAGNLVLAVAAWGYGDALVHPVWPALYGVLLAGGFMYCWPILMALVSRAAPAAVNATMMGVAMSTLFVANILAGWIGSLYESLSAPAFWALHATVAAVGGLLVLVCGRALERGLDARVEP